MIKLAGLLSILLLIGGCLDDKQCLDDNPNVATEGNQIFNPNGDSELALLMRDMFDDGMQVKSKNVWLGTHLKYTSPRLTGLV